MPFRRPAIRLSLLVSLSCLSLSCAPLAHATDGDSVTVPKEELDQLIATYALVKSQYVEAPDERKLLTAAIGGMLASLDPHSQYLDKDELAALEQDRLGEYVGIGIEVEVEDGQLYVVSVAEDGPAEKAGIEAGDTLETVNGDAILRMRAAELEKRIRGVPGTALTLGVRHGGKGEVRKVDVTRAALRTDTVRTRMAAPGVAWIRISSFEGRTAADLAAALAGLGADGAPCGIVLDLRNDPGGLVSAAVGVAGAFLQPGTVLFSARGRMAGADSTVTVDQRYYRDRGEADVLAALPAWTRTVPLTVLVNGGSASSAELVAGALQDHGRAKIVGTQTFGKGSIQTVFPLSEDSAVKMTVARYFTPKGREIQARGITPDVVVALPAGKRGADGLVLREADLAHHLQTTLPAQDTARPAPRAAPESTRMFGTDDDRALATAVRMLAPDLGLAHEAGALLRKLGLKIEASAHAAAKSL